MWCKSAPFLLTQLQWKILSASKEKEKSGERRENKNKLNPKIDLPDLLCAASTCRALDLLCAASICRALDLLCATSTCRALWLSGDVQGTEAGHLHWISCLLLNFMSFLFVGFDLELVRQQPYGSREVIKHTKRNVKILLSNHQDFPWNP